MSNVGERVKGVFNTVHGLGENVRATALGAVDTIAHDKEGEMKNDQIAQQGRLETTRGMEQMSGRPRNVNTTANYDTTTADPSLANHPATSDYPQHHRDNEVYNDSQANAVRNPGSNAPSTQPGYNTSGGVQPSENAGYGTQRGNEYGGAGVDNANVNPSYNSDNAQYDTGNPRY
ncbi:uncharacterized protein C8R40DRAFT_1164538 [Lentinula edodes]|uniref:uncharacterized protein n=1 Tax=Lentinula edodes TaxID=5353 RepID=UPI001E8DB35F|nr:uncharacterized protein C8R40DRAFT_1164538 [Lentinula edodes]KAH7881124.1 hypothetical protein C8R40DRAFT_1164538 [Lentinula edodes]